MAHFRRHATTLLLLLLLVLECGCSTVTLKSKGAAPLDSPPSWESEKRYYFWGLVGNHRIRIGEICQKSKAKQFQMSETFFQGFLTFVTLGIYWPRTARVWCEEKE